MSRGLVHRTKRLLPMEYKPSELAEELGVNVKTIYRAYMPNGCPYRRDKNSHIWIMGTQFREWALTVLSQRTRDKKPALSVGQQYCVKCRQTVVVTDATTQHFGTARRLVGKCPNCGLKLYRMLPKEKT